MSKDLRNAITNDLIHDQNQRLRLKTPGFHRRDWRFESVNHSVWTHCDELVVQTEVCMLKTFYNDLKTRESFGMDFLVGFRL